MTVENDPTIEVGGIQVLPVTGAGGSWLPPFGIALIAVGSLLLAGDARRRGARRRLVLEV